MTNYLVSTNIWAELVELLATRPITIHEFHSTGMDRLKKLYFWVILNLNWHVINRHYNKMVCLWAIPLT